ncbi:hypothetical protein C8Q78DRAFT_953848, partial [Trametes maxima]
MLGQRIIESYADLENEDSSLLRAEPCTGLTIRRIKSAGLRIVTESELPSPDAPDGVLQDQTHTLYPPSHPYSRLSVRTPDTSHTFGLPNPSMLSPYARSPRSFAATPSSASTERHIARRLSRYSRAESALHSAVEASSAEISPHELQIRVLEQATAMLSEQARDAQACAERLRACLADKELSLEELKALQRERWLEERKSNSRQSQSAQARDLLTKLSSPIREETPLFDSPSAMSRREANLARFLRRSPTRVVFPLMRSPSVSPVSPFRRETISQVRPMRLRASAMELALRSPLRVHTRSKSLDSGHSRSNSESTDATFVSQGSSGQTTVAQASSPPLKGLPPSSPPLLPHTMKGDVDGVVSIAALAKLRPRDELLAEVGDVSLPDYAVDLLENLVASSLDISLHEIATADRTPAKHVHSESSPDIAFPSPSPADDTPPAGPSTPLRTLGRQRSQSDVPLSPTFPPTTSPSPRRRAGASPKPSFRQSLLVPKFSSLRLSSPSLVPVPEGSSGDAHSRPQSSMSGFPHVFDSSSAVHVNGGTDTDSERTGDHRRFSVISFRR